MGVRERERESESRTDIETAKCTQGSWSSPGLCPDYILQLPQLRDKSGRRPGNEASRDDGHLAATVLSLESMYHHVILLTSSHPLDIVIIRH